MKRPIPYNEVIITERESVKFGNETFDNYISTNGGIERGTMIALSGTAGAGKTTMCKKFQKDLRADEVSVFFALESSKASVSRQTQRIKTSNKDLICDNKDFPTWGEFMEYLYAEKPLMVIVDSLQHAAELLSKENGKYKYDNYKEIVKSLYTWKDETQGIVILICQLNADGKFEGPQSTIFDTDCPIKLTADPKTGERFMTTEKNRMGKIGTIFYELVDTDECIEFYTEDEWKVVKKGASLPAMINKTIEAYLEANSRHDNYKEFRKEFTKEYGKIYNSNDDDFMILAEAVKLISVLVDKYLA